MRRHRQPRVFALLPRRASGGCQRGGGEERRQLAGAGELGGAAEAAARRVVARLPGPEEEGTKQGVTGPAEAKPYRIPPL